MASALERAARAMFVGGVEHISDGDGWDDLPELFKNMMATKVRAVLMAVRGVDGFGIDVNYWSARVVDVILNEKDATND